MATDPLSQTKQEAVDRALAALGLPPLPLRRGSTILKEFFISVADRMGLGLEPDEMTMPQMGRALVESAGLVWDHSCESTGSTVTLEGLQRIEASVRWHLSRVGTVRIDPEVVDAVAAAGTPAGRSSGQSFLQSTALRVALGHYAEEKARDLYQGEGWTTEIVGATQSYDVHCSRGEDETLCVEAKATLGEGSEVLLTYAEVEHARSVYPQTALVVVSRISANESDGGSVQLSGGDLRRISPWLPGDEDLQPIQYRYRVPPLKIEEH